MGNTLRKLVYVVLVAVSLCLAPTVVNAGPFGPLTPQEVGKICSRCESIITKNLPEADASVYIKKTSAFDVKCSDNTGDGLICAPVVGAGVKEASCDPGDLKMNTTPAGSYFAMWNGQQVVVASFYPAGALDAPGDPYGNPQQTQVVGFKVCANTNP